MGIVARLFGKCVPVSELKRLKKYYNELLVQKEKEIAELHRDNEFLIRNAMEQAKKRSEIAEHGKKLLEINKQLKELAKK